jgi:hypothetical protein
MSYATLSFCNLQDKRILYICVCEYVRVCMCVFCPAVHMQVWTHDPCFIWTSPKRPKGGVSPNKRYTKSRILKTPIDPYRLCCVQWDVLWNFFVLHFTGHCIYICPAVHMQVWNHDPCFIWSSPKRPKGGVWGSSLGCNNDTCKVCRRFEVTCKLTPNQKAVGPCGCRDPTAGSLLWTEFSVKLLQNCGGQFCLSWKWGKFWNIEVKHVQH